MRPTATVFDLDETLVDSADAWNRVFGRVAARHGEQWTPADWVAIQGKSTAHWSAHLARRCPDLTPATAVAECVTGMVAALAGGEFGLLPGAAALVATAAELGPIALVSASPRPYVEAAITTLGLPFTTSVSGDDVVHGKPAPDPYLLAAQRLGVDPSGCVAVEDSSSGIRSAHAAGMTVLAVPNPTAAGDFTTLALAAHQAADAFVAAKIVDQLLSR
ncbi:HAD family phosphatase [Amycolatopsis rhabdoformis]|uniref:HAD family phosphatase n=1 Tax=Amycolatopsis rhabdoformis TaxID=1448059 RepID=A0ABZ1I2T5_9PSEU|nr:HAD family phosphatase [Amycolatopsis rhabdoformis]WSE28128.1 HAD family phosphatase [Amycolatopsis rhabdoformis]